MTIALTLWIFAAAFLACSGWILSALGALDRVGYAVALFIGFSICFGILRQAAVRPKDALLLFRRIKWHLRRPMPLAFLLIVIFSFVGGALYDPVHYDSLSYRTPRVLHWLADGRWHWIHTEDIRLNIVAPGIEWIWTPVFLFLQSERWLCLASAVSLIFLPGLVFGCFTGLGARPRVVWWWMWIIPSGYCYSMQGGSVATDGCSSVLRSRLRRQSVSCGRRDLRYEGSTRRGRLRRFPRYFGWKFHPVRNASSRDNLPP